MHLVAHRDLPQFAGTPRGGGLWGRLVRAHERRQDENAAMAASCLAARGGDGRGERLRPYGPWPKERLAGAGAAV
jgi:hypothetical protein